MPTSRTDQNTFVVQTWFEQASDGVRQWRACVTHVSTGSRRFFTNYIELEKFLELWK